MEDAKPLILNPGKKSDADTIRALRRKGARVVDTFDEQARELALVRRASLMRDRAGLAKAAASIEAKKGIDRWVYFPWRNALVRLLNEKDFATLRLSRNAFLIAPEEQEKFSRALVAVAGLNVGNPAALCMALGGLGRMKFADLDGLSVANFNRFRASLADLGVNKATLTARQVYETNPYADIELYEQGITPENLERFLDTPRPDVLVEEMDNLPLKIRIREEAKKRKIPVVMVTGNGAGIILDVERYDKKPYLPILNGYLKKEIANEILAPGFRETPLERKIELARDFMGKPTLTRRLQAAFEEVGRSIPGIPQIGEASYLRGAVVSYAVRMIVTGGAMPSGRFHIRLEDSSTKKA